MFMENYMISPLVPSCVAEFGIWSQKYGQADWTYWSPEKVMALWPEFILTVLATSQMFFPVNTAEHFGEYHPLQEAVGWKLGILFGRGIAWARESARGEPKADQKQKSKF